MLDLTLVNTFMTVAAENSFRKAAEILHCSPSTVTARIKSLEEELGVALFSRAGRDAALTEQGLRLLQQAPRLLAMEASLKAALRDESAPPQEVSMRLSQSLGVFCLPLILPAFLDAFPDARLTASTVSPHGLVHDLRRGVFDLACILAEPFAASGLSVEILGQAEILLIAPPDSPLAGLERAGPKDLAGVPLFLTPRIWSARRFVESALLEARTEARTVVECASVEMVKRCVMAGLGVSFAPRCAVRQEAREGKLALLGWEPGPLAAPVLLISDKDRPMAPAAHGMRELLREFFGRSPHWHENVAMGA